MCFLEIQDMLLYLVFKGYWKYVLFMYYKNKQKIKKFSMFVKVENIQIIFFDYDIIKVIGEK